MVEFRDLPLADMSVPEVYAALSSLVVPRPIAFVSTLSPDGVPNLAPFSYFMLGGSNPPSLMVSPTPFRDGRDKDTLRNIVATGEFTVNSVHRPMAEGMNATSRPVPPHESEWDESGFNPLPSRIVRPARVAESLFQFECRLFQVVEHGTGHASARYVIAEIVALHVAESLFIDGKVQSPNLLARLGGPVYYDLATGEKFSLERPR